MSDLRDAIDRLAVCNTHEHQQTDEAFLASTPDVLTLLFANYVTADLRVAGMEQKDIDRLVAPTGEDIAARFGPAQRAWQRCRLTGYGEGVRRTAAHFFGIDRISAGVLEQAQRRLPARWQPGDRLRVLRDEGGFDHVQVNDWTRLICHVDRSGAGFYFPDIAWPTFARGLIERQAIAEATGVEVRNLASLRRAMERVFEINAPHAIAVKSQHAYHRTLAWRARTDGEAAAALEKALVLKHDAMDEADRFCLGDWCLARGVELSIEHRLPFKIHTGYHAGHGYSRMDWISPAHLCPLLTAYPQARFVLMHAGYPYGAELVAMAKHFANVWADLCWAWAIDPQSTSLFVRSFLAAAPAHRLLGFGGDSFWPHISVGYGLQARDWLARTLEQEQADGRFDEAEAMQLASLILRDNALELFDVQARRAATAAASVA
ncbi:MAG: hypothetical protein BIFFINMI_03960 [Phycisphaerae bacterium]|nr:hypothetical protein [Phycisphaerae bacterium]